MPTVLIVEDGEVAAEALARLIRRAGFQADRAATGEGALAYLRQLTPDLVVCDLLTVAQRFSPQKQLVLLPRPRKVPDFQGKTRVVGVIVI